MNEETVKATVKVDAIYCGKCNHKLAVIKGLKSGLGNGTIYLKCNHKDSSQRCRTINEIEL
jgi:hypothetical protein